MKVEIVFKDGTKKTFYSVERFAVEEEQTAYKEFHEYEVTQTPIEGKLFEVNPLGLDRSRFEKPMKDYGQEGTRRLFRKHLQKLTSILKNMLHHSTR